MQDDLTWGVKALVADGTADPRRIGSSGSYGGYATLAGVAFTPHLRCCRSDCRAIEPHHAARRHSPYWEAGRRQLYARNGRSPFETNSSSFILFLLKPGYGRSSLLGGSFGTPGRGNPTAPRPVSASASVADKPPHELKRLSH
jgi:hypothetical protein